MSFDMCFINIYIFSQSVTEWSTFFLLFLLNTRTKPQNFSPSLSPHNTHHHGHITALVRRESLASHRLVVSSREALRRLLLLPDPTLQSGSCRLTAAASAASATRPSALAPPPSLLAGACLTCWAFSGRSLRFYYRFGWDTVYLTRCLVCCFSLVCILSLPCLLRSILTYLDLNFTMIHPYVSHL